MALPGLTSQVVTVPGIIDVPGHEKFINNMVAGVVGMDLVMLVSQLMKV